uniref:Uncharacterized protein n=1 Tax=Magnetococcus massalia (strain MO-1) TaxID=451514 RepID=A0A1S7LGN7_MAGMO|nr:Exported protein of unknown function [Candidatus Magnetococcus massalia]
MKQTIQTILILLMLWALPVGSAEAEGKAGYQDCLHLKQAELAATLQEGMLRFTSAKQRGGKISRQQRQSIMMVVGKISGALRQFHLRGKRQPGCVTWHKRYSAFTESVNRATQGHTGRKQAVKNSCPVNWKKAQAEISQLESYAQEMKRSSGGMRAMKARALQKRLARSKLFGKLHKLMKNNRTKASCKGLYNAYRDLYKLTK